MISDEYILRNPDEDHRFIPQEAQTTAEYLGLDAKASLRLRLLAEEMICMLPQLLSYGQGKFWIETHEKNIELHLNVKIDKTRDYDVGKILSVSKSGKNAAAKGIIGKIAVAVESMLGANENSAIYDSYGVWSRGLADYDEATIWSLEAYKDAFKSQDTQQDYQEDWDELEKSILANLADDVRVGVLGGKIDIVVIKNI
jgi:hypothetical protein